MTTLTRPTAPPRRGPRSDPRHPRRHAGALRPEQLPRPIPRSQWDPLTVDVEAEEKVDYERPPTLEATGPPLDDLSKVASILTKAVAEVLLGTRSINQIQAWLLDDVWHVIRRRAHLSQRSEPSRKHPSAVRIIRVHPCQVDERTCELSVVLHDGYRVRAAALRLTLHRQRWRAAAIRIG
ncbi:MAG TPA: Rv3235 family protein [Beutenbergiaceae bacterium]|nr:Rv3235 family protein [Beutenbergiaceae bacterium]